MTKTPWLVAALVLPFVVLGHGIWKQQSNLSASGEWRIPISGYDPRDPLRGQYIRFTYDWELRGDAKPCLAQNGCQLCLSRDDDHVVATVETPGTLCPNRVDTRASNIGTSPAFPSGSASFSSRLFVSETSAPALEILLREKPMHVVAALGPDGRLVNRRIEPQDSSG